MKKSKILLTLVVVVLLCSLIFAFAGCNNDKEPEVDPNAGNNNSDNNNDNTDNGEDDLKFEYIDEWAQLINDAFVFEGNKVGTVYSVVVPVANTAEGKAREIQISVKARLDAATANENFFELSAAEKIGDTAPAEVFVLQADEKDVYLRFKGNDGNTYVRKFPGLELAAMVAGKELPKNVGSSINTIASAVTAIVPTDATKTDNGDGSVTYAIAPDMKFIGNLLGNLVIGFVPENVSEHLQGTLNGAVADLETFMGSIKPVFNCTAKDGKFTQFNIDIDTTWGPAHVLITPTFGADVKPVATKIDKASAMETNLLNFSLAGEFKMDATYNYVINADVDVFCMIRNLINNGKTNLDKIFNGTKTKLFVNVKKANADIFALAFDYNVDERLYINYDADAILPQAFVDAVFPGNALANGKQTIVLDPAALIKAATPAPVAPADPNAPKPAEKVAGPVLVAEELNDAAYANAMKVFEKNGTKPAGTVRWNAVKDAKSYNVTVAGVKSNQTTTSVAATSGQVVTVEAVFADGTTSKVSSITFIDGRATAKAVAKAISMLTAIDFNYTNYDVVVSGILLKDFVKALNAAVEVKAGNLDLNALVNTFPISDEISVNVKTAGFFVEANHTANVAADFCAIAGVKDAAAMKALATTKF